MASAPTVVIPSAPPPSKNPFDDDCDTDQLRGSSGGPSPASASPAIRPAGPVRGPRLRSTGGGNGGACSGGSTASTGGCCAGRPCCRRCADCCFTCTARCTRVLLVGPNLLFLLFGATLVGLGVWMRADRESPFYLEILRRVPASPVLTVDQLPVAIIAVGSCVAILSFLGCCGACFESVCFLCLYALFLVLMVAAEIVVGIIIAVMHEQLLLKLAESMKQQIKYDYNMTDFARNADNSSYHYHLTAAWASMHDQFMCCGAEGPQDFYQSAWYNRTNPRSPAQHIVPPSCCWGPSASHGPVSEAHQTDCQQAASLMLRDPKDLSLDLIRHSSLKTQGCKQSLLLQLRRSLSILIGVGCAVVLLQIVDFGFACVLMSWFRKKQSEYPWYEDDDFD